MLGRDTWIRKWLENGWVTESKGPSCFSAASRMRNSAPEPRSGPSREEDFDSSLRVLRGQMSKFEGVEKFFRAFSYPCLNHEPFKI